MESSSWLQEHLRSRHPAVGPFASVYFNWHLHVDYPDSADENNCEACRGRQDRQPNGPAFALQSTLLADVAGKIVAVDLSDFEPANLSIAAPAANLSSLDLTDRVTPSPHLALRPAALRC